MLRAARLSCLASCLVLLTACAEPPAKEMNQAEGAIEAARAAGADQYAPEELQAAIDALARAQEAVAQNDYRLALSHAIDSRERAQNAAKLAVERRANARGEAERLIAEAGIRLTQAQARLDAPELAKLPRATVASARQALETAQETMQEARAALGADHYARASELARTVMARVEDALTGLDKATDTAAGRKRR